MHSLSCITPHEDLVEALTEANESVSIDGKVLMTVSRTIRTLCNMLDDKLVFSDHVTQNIQEALGRLRRLYQVEDLLQEPPKLHVYKLLSILYINTAILHMATVPLTEDTERIPKIAFDTYNQVCYNPQNATNGSSKLDTDLR